ncbi:MAG: HlyD family efflux transporter periplasmic adaptor subunit, partial [Planctomycetes bacterium]|nr:HlyD family efflux transporter periplasmic adaptor subunit [Planctomycetota bacterium]
MQTMKKQSKRGLTVSITMLVVVIIISMAAAGAWAMFYVGAGNSASIDNDIFAVKKGGFEIVVPTSGELAALRQIEIKNRLETRATITEIIEEGEHVKKGDLLISFNDEDIRNKIKDADDALDSAKNSLENAKANLEIRKKTRESELARAELEITLTELALQAWREGEDVTRRQDLALELKTAQMEYDRLQVYFEASKRLFEQEFISLDEYTRNEIALVRAESNLKQANLDIDVYEKYEYLQDREKKESDRKQAVDEQDRTKQRYDAEVRSAESDVRSAERMVESRQERFDKWTTQLELCVILAPSDGLVVYASSLSSGGHFRGNEDPPMVGTDVARNRTVIVLPDTSQMIAEVKVNEALSGMIKPGQRATVVSDALPDTVLSGEVMSVGVLAQTGGWRDPNRRDYTVKILLDDFALSLGLKPSMRCRADIKVGRVDDTLYIAMAGFHQLWELDLPSGQIAPYAGDGIENIVDGPRMEAQLAQPYGLTVSEDMIFFADSETSAVRSVPDIDVDTELAMVETLIGDGLFDFGDRDGAFGDAILQHVQATAVMDGVLYIADSYNHK